VDDHCNTNTKSATYDLGSSYDNDTGTDGEEAFFTGSFHFISKSNQIKLNEIKSKKKKKKKKRSPQDHIRNGRCATVDDTHSPFS
jgi:hypothetical protein